MPKKALLSARAAKTGAGVSGASISGSASIKCKHFTSSRYLGKL